MSGHGRWSKTFWLGPVRVAIGRGNGLRRYFVSRDLLLLGHYMLSVRIERDRP